MFLVWTGIALFSLAQSTLLRATSHQPPVPFSTVAVIAGNCWLWALHTPLIRRRAIRDGIVRPPSSAQRSTGLPNPRCRARRNTSAAAAASSAATPTDL